MINFLRKIFIKNYEDVKNQKVREAHGRLASFVGVFSNLFLFIIKLLAGIISGSIAIIADSINNLSDMGSSIITLIGFKLANMPADDEHPYGHERLEYIAGLIVSIIVIFVGGSLFITSIEKIIYYEYNYIEDVISYVTIGILAISILTKLWQSLFNKRIGKLIDSVALEATSLDSRNDCISTSVILIGTIITLLLGDVGFSIDGILGIIVSLLIIYSGAKLIKETTDPLIGSAVSKEYVSEIVEYIKADSNVYGVHDVVCHMYGPTKCFMTLHAEVDSECDIIKVHDAIDALEQGVRGKYGVELTIHMDPIELNNEELNKIKEFLNNVILNLDEKLHYHDLRLVRKLSKSTILFDIVIPYKYKLSEEEITKHIQEKILEYGDYVVLINYDHNFIC